MMWNLFVKTLEQHYSQKDLATLLSCDPTQIRRWKRGSHTPGPRSQELLRRLAKECGVDWRDVEGRGTVYDLNRSYRENYLAGPVGLESVSYPAISNVPVRFLGSQLNSPIGLGSGPLTMNRHWTLAFSKCGFDVITGKTNRTKAVTAQPKPNWVYVPQITAPIVLGEIAKKSFFGSYELPHADLSELTMANSFGIPSSSPEEWKADIQETVAMLKKGQVFLASVIGSSDTPGDDKALLRDWVICARHAAEAKPFGIELNFSCPVGYHREGIVSENISAAREICRRIRKELPTQVLFVKISYLSRSALKGLFDAVFPYVDGFTAINTISAKVLADAEDTPPIFPSAIHREAGISGAAIRAHAIQTVRWINEFRQECRKELALIGAGGIASAADARQFMSAGADVVQLCTAANRNPRIAIELREALGGSSDLRRSATLLGEQVLFSTPEVRQTYAAAVQASRSERYPLDKTLQLVQRRHRTSMIPPSEEEIVQWIWDEKRRTNR